MSVAYKGVQWNRHKRVYDVLVALCIEGYLLAFVGVGMLVWRGAHAISPEILVMRALGSAAIVLLHVILCIGPLARLSDRFAPLLYNRRHLGVTMFILALAHAVLAIGYYGGFGVRNPLLAVLAGAPPGLSGGAFPFELAGFGALLVLFVMAATSHDFWLKNLSPGVWKSLHMGVYGAYGLLVLHVGFGAVQSDRHWPLGAALAFGAAVIGTLHAIAGSRELRRDRAGPSAPRVPADQTPWIDVASFDEIPDGRARVVCVKGQERVAVFRNGQTVSAVSNVCAHQGGPLGEGKIVGGCITCPWHGYQYLPATGGSPPPFTEKIPTYRVRIEGRRVLLDPQALAPGTRVEPAEMREGPPHA